MTITEYARHRGCRLNAVQVAVLAGRIRRDAAGLIDSVAADRDWRANTREVMLGPNLLSRANEQVAGPIEAVPGMTYAEARAISAV